MKQSIRDVSKWKYETYNEAHIELLSTKIDSGGTLVGPILHSSKIILAVDDEFLCKNGKKIKRRIEIKIDWMLLLKE